MAFVKFKQRDSHGHLAATMTYAQAKELEKVMKGLINGSKRQKDYASNVESIYFGKGQERASTHVTERVNELWPVVERRDING